MDNPLVSIIVPIYKSEKYIERCIRSLMEQSMKDGVEFIFINDCTPDGSMYILREVINDYPSRKEQINIIENSTNLGISKTRDVAIKESTGKYIAWCDSDDWIEKDALQIMWDAASCGTIDIVVFNYCLEGEKRIDVIHSTSLTPQDALENSWRKTYMPLGLPFHLIRRGLLEYAVSMIVPTNQGEDTYMLRYIYYKAKTIRFIPAILYHYDRTNNASITHNSIITSEQWYLHKKNIDQLSELLINTKQGYKRYHKAVNFLKYYRKYQYRSSFSNIFDYYYTFRSCYLDINSILDVKKSTGLKTFLIFNIFPFFWFYFHKSWNK